MKNAIQVSPEQVVFSGTEEEVLRDVRTPDGAEFTAPTEPPLKGWLVYAGTLEDLGYDPRGHLATVSRAMLPDATDLHYWEATMSVDEEGFFPELTATVTDAGPNDVPSSAAAAAQLATYYFSTPDSES